MSEKATCAAHNLPIVAGICPYASEIGGVEEVCEECCPKCAADCAGDI